MRIGGYDIGNTAACPHHKNAVGDIEHLIDIMADNEQRVPLRPQTAQQLHGLVGLPNSHGGGRLIQKEELPRLQHGTGDGKALPLAARKNTDRLGKVGDGDFQPPQKRGSFPLHPAAVKKRSPHPFMAEEDVFIAVFAVVKGKILINGADAHLQRLRNGKTGIFPALYGNTARIRGEIAGKQLDQGGFAGSVIPHNGGCLSLLYREGDIPQCRNGAEGFAESRNGNDGIRHGCTPSKSEEKSNIS